MSIVRVIYVFSHHREEQVEFRTDDPEDEILSVFRAAGETVSDALIKLVDQNGKLINISADLLPNTPDTRYKIETIGLPCGGDPIYRLLGVDVFQIEMELERLERQVLLAQKPTDNTAGEALSSDPIDIENFVVRKILTVKSEPRLAWFGLNNSFPAGIEILQEVSADTEDDRGRRCKKVIDNFRRYSNTLLTASIRKMLTRSAFDNWEFEDHELLLLLRQMFIDLKLISTFHIEIPLLNDFLVEIYRHYNKVPFHSFKHGFMVTQMVYSFINIIGLQQYLQDFDILVLLVSAMCHDIDHPGYNNSFQINMRTMLALRYNDISPLENHHSATSFSIMSTTQVFRNLSPQQFKRFREKVIKCIMATDMARHHEILENFKAIVPAFNVDEKEHKELLLSILIKVSDISNEVRPVEVSNRWVDCLFREFSNQYHEETKSLPAEACSAFMNPNTVHKSSSQVQFIRYVLLPLYQALGSLFPIINDEVVAVAKKALDFWAETALADDEFGGKEAVYFQPPCRPQYY